MKLIALIILAVLVCILAAVWFRRRRSVGAGHVAPPPPLDPIVIPDPETPAGRLAQALLMCVERMSSFPALGEQARQMHDLIVDLIRPVTLVVMGQFKTGKSSFINALLGEDLLTVDVTPATAAVTIIKYGPEARITAVYTTGHKVFPVTELGRLSAETDIEGTELRQSLRYLEVELPNPVLQQINIVDTPGLNSSNALHTEATEQFMQRADVIFWLFAYGGAGTATEVAAIRALNDGLKPVAVVNRIDEHDPDEGSVDEVLEALRRRLGPLATEVIGTSALLARTAGQEQRPELMTASRWEQVQAVVDKYCLTGGHPRKLQRIFARLTELVAQSQEALQPASDEYQQAAQVRDDEAGYRKNLATLKETLAAYQQHWQPDSKEKPELLIFFVADRANLTEYMPDYKVLAAQHESLRGVAHTLNEQMAALNGLMDEHKRQGEAHQADLAAYNAAGERWQKSGLFGGAPILESIFGGGERARLEKWLAEVNSRADRLNAEREDLRARWDALMNRAKRASAEAKEFIAKVRKALDATTRRYEKEAADFGKVRKAAVKSLHRLRWVPEAEAFLKEESLSLVGGPALDLLRELSPQPVAVPASWQELHALWLRVETDQPDAART